jgi:ribosome-associated toxin RatA of RatAB toxin-antitoxin module
MTAIHRSALMPYSAGQMYDVVIDIERYPDFLPWCAATEILEHRDDFMRASIHMRKGKLNHAFTTRNRLVPGRQVHMELEDGPFRKLEGDWLLTSLPGDKGCKVALDLEFEFSNRLVGMLIGPVFTQIANSLVDAFCQRAHQMYRENGQ